MENELKPRNMALNHFKYLTHFTFHISRQKHFSGLWFLRIFWYQDFLQISLERREVATKERKK